MCRCPMDEIGTLFQAITEIGNTPQMKAIKYFTLFALTLPCGVSDHK